MKTIKVFGVAGSGKTTTCLSMIKCILNIEDDDIPEKIKKLFVNLPGDYSFTDICFSSFTVAAIRSIINKIRISADVDIPKEHYFKTLHKLTWRLCGYDGSNILPKSEKEEFFEKNGFKFRREIEDTPSEGEEIVDLYNSLINYYSKSLEKIEDVEIRNYLVTIHKKNTDSSLNEETTIFILRRYYNWKQEIGKADYSDSLINVYENEIDIPCKILIVDEAQDLSKLQANIIELWTKKYNKDIFVLAGDDDQTVHEWAGATPDYLVEHGYDHKLILEESYRLPNNIANFCNGILKTINYREEKWISSKKDNGKIEYLSDSGLYLILDLIIKKFLDKKNYFLFRTNIFKKHFGDCFFANTTTPFGYLGGFKSKWSFKFVCVCNALNKIQQKADLMKKEVEYLFECLPSKTCLIYGVKTKVKNSKKGYYTWKEVLEMTKLWKFQTTLDGFERVDFSFKKIKEKILIYVEYVKTKTEKEIKENEIYKRKMSEMKQVVNMDVDENSQIVGFDNMIGTFHSAKGLEADNVFVFLGTSNYFKDVDDSERRIFYTACSRPLKNLYFVGSMLEEGQQTHLEKEFKHLILNHTRGKNECI